MRGLYARLLAPSLGVTFAAIAVAAIVVPLARLRPGTVLEGYLSSMTLMTLFVTLLWTLLVALRYGLSGLERPVPRIARRLYLRLPMLLLPALLFPVFMAAYTTAKSGIPFLIGFHWDGALAALDRSIFAVDPWRLTHRLIGATGTALLVIAYCPLWGVALVLVPAVLALCARARLVTVYFAAMMATWLIGGVGFAYLLSSAGPALVHAVDPGLGTRFAGLVSAIAHLPAYRYVGWEQQYLIADLHQPVVVEGGGISAMPSMHVATATVYLLAARGTRWFWPAAIFALVIWLGSVHFGFHYAVDGPAAAAIAVCCWSATGRLSDLLARMPAAQAAPAAAAWRAQT